ncbi:hypothetical protein AX17_003218 [Amanita inopinata Kibby_2008]|nr:hypothetical protein AX17_003218 [Amanita inopinata Kibby_2008]
MGNGPSIFSKTPYEFAKDYKRRKRVPLQQRRSLYPPPPGYILVQFLSNLEQMHKPPFLDFEAYFPLDDKGGFDLSLVRRAWGLESCLPIEPSRWKVFNPGSDDYLSPLAVYMLSRPRIHYVKVTEPHASSLTQMQRTCRGAVSDVIDGIAQVYRNTKLKSYNYIQYNTQFLIYYRAAQEQRRQLVLVYKNWHENWEQELGPGSVIQTFILLFLLFFYGFIRLGWVGFKLRQRLWVWVRTGSFMLPTMGEGFTQ